MTKRLSLLAALAIVAVVCNHSVQQSFNILHWTQAARPLPDYELGLTYYGLITVEKLATFSVPAFLFISGFFVAYAARGAQASFKWKSALKRVTALVVPYVIWTVVFFLVNAMSGNVTSPQQYAWQLVHGVVPAYYFVILLCQFYILSPLLVPLAKTHGTQVLVGSAILQLAVVSLTYLNTRDSHHWEWYLFPTWAFFFVFGLCVGLRLEALKRWLAQYRGWLLMAVLAFGALAIVEADLSYRYLGLADWRDRPFTLPTSLYAIAFVLYFLAAEERRLPLGRAASALGSRTYGIYLLHPLIAPVVVQVLLLITPGLAANPLTLQPLLIAALIGLPLLLMLAIARSPARKSYQYLFG
jgi:peptidoglycan/LPS O-acetylase OafA/YrhL